MTVKYSEEYLINTKFGRLTVESVYRIVDTKGKLRRWCHCKCECGNKKDAPVNSLVKGAIQSCGCLHRDNGINICKRRAKHNLRSHPLYDTWRKMINRCNDPKAKGYENYGGRGISVCERWLKDPRDFVQCCLEKGWRKELTIDRINNDGNYEPDNIRFVNRHIQSTNRRVLKNNKSGYTGVYWKARSKRWVAEINVNKKTKTIGYFASKKDALDARNKYIIDHSLTEYKIQKWKGE